MNFFFSSILTFLSVLLYSQQGTININVYDEFSRQPLKAAITVRGSEELQVEGKGLIEIKDLPVGTYTFEINSDQYETSYLNDINIIPNQNISYSVGLTKILESNDIDAVIIRKTYKTSVESPVSLRNITSEEIQKNAGSNRDVSKAMLSFPGVGSTANFRNDLFIRGGNSSENKFYVDGIEVPVINHFQTQGASGGPRGILTVDFIKDVDFYSGAFPAKRNGMLSSLFEFNLKDARKEKLGYKAVVGLDDMQLMADGPLSKDGSLSGLFSVRKSNLQLLFKTIGLPFLPSYYDGTFKVSKKFKQGDELYFLGIGAIDQFEFNSDAKKTPSNLNLIDKLPKSPQWSYTIGAGYRHLVDNGNWLFTISRSQLDNKATKYFRNIEQPNYLLYDYHSQEEEDKLRIDRSFRWNRFSFEVGVNLNFATYFNNSINKSVSQNEIDLDEFESKINFIQYGFYVNTQRKFLNNNLQLSVGLRVDASDYSNKMSNLMDQFSPRLSIKYRLSKKWSINFNTGRYFQLPAFTSLGFMKNNQLINKNHLKYIQNTHVVSGIEYNGQNNLKISLEGYYKKYKNYPFSIRNQVSLANLGGGFGVLGNEPVDVRGKGETYGFEFLAQKRTINNYYGILAYTFGYSKFTDNHENYIPSSWDTRHILSATVGKNFAKNWNIGARFRLQSGFPETPYDLTRSALVEVWNVNNSPVQDFSLLNQLRGNLTHQLDVRVEKKWVFKKWQFTTYLDIVNIYGSKSPSTLPVVSLERDNDGNGIIINPNAPINQQAYKLEKEQNDRVTPLPYFGFIFEF